MEILKMKVKKCGYLAAVTVFLLLSCAILLGQSSTGNVHGQVADPSGAAISGASVVLTPATGAPIVMQSNAQGLYEFKNVAAGKYTLTVAATGFTLFENDDVEISERAVKLDVSMAIDGENEAVEGSATGP